MIGAFLVGCRVGELGVDHDRNRKGIADGRTGAGSRSHATAKVFHEVGIVKMASRRNEGMFDVFIATYLT